MSRAAKRAQELTEADLSRWRLVEDFRQRLQAATQRKPLAATWSDPHRQLEAEDYLSLFLFGLLNPVVNTMRGLCSASSLGRVQREVCSHRVSLGSFSEAQHLVEPELLQEVFHQLAQELEPPARERAPAQRWLIQDGSLFDALPRMYWALWRRQNQVQCQVRLHLSLDLEQEFPAQASITAGRKCERAQWRQQVKPGQAYVADRYYGEHYQLLAELDQLVVAFVVRLREEATVEVERELELSSADRQAGVIRAAWVWLGHPTRRPERLFRVVWVQTPKEVLRLVTNFKDQELTPAEVALFYKQRWKIELFFRWVKCILGCRHWIAESPQGTAIQIYLALIAALLLQLYTGQRPNKRMFELIRFYLLGVATLEELWAGIELEKARLEKHKKA